MRTYCTENLLELEGLIRQIPEDKYIQKLDILSFSSIGQHMRHILEFYICLLDARGKNVVNYDLRKRDLLLENDPKFAIHTIQNITTAVQLLDMDKPLVLEGTFNAESNSNLQIKSTYGRELAYNLEHSIHHQALIKIGLREVGALDLVTSDFGVAPATIKYYAS